MSTKQLKHGVATSFESLYKTQQISRIGVIAVILWHHGFEPPRFDKKYIYKSWFQFNPQISWASLLYILQLQDLFHRLCWCWFWWWCWFWCCFWFSPGKFAILGCWTIWSHKCNTLRKGINSEEFWIAFDSPTSFFEQTFDANPRLARDRSCMSSGSNLWGLAVELSKTINLKR